MNIPKKKNRRQLWKQNSTARLNFTREKRNSEVKHSDQIVQIQRYNILSQALLGNNTQTSMGNQMFSKVTLLLGIAKSISSREDAHQIIKSFTG